MLSATDSTTLRSAFLAAVSMVLLATAAGCLDKYGYVANDTGNDAEESNADGAAQDTSPMDTAADTTETEDTAPPAPDTTTADTTPADTRADSGDTCTPTNNGREVCDDVDNDCDGEVDERTNCTFVKYIKPPPAYYDKLQPMGVALDGNGSVYVAGTASGDPTQAFVGKYDTVSGKKAWFNIYNSPDPVGVSDAVADSNGVVIAGSTDGKLGGVSPPQNVVDGFVARVKNDGTLGSAALFGSQSSARFESVAHSAGTLYAIGSNDVAGSQSNATVAAYDAATLNQKWTYTHTPMQRGEFGADVAVNSNGVWASMVEGVGQGNAKVDLVQLGTRNGKKQGETTATSKAFNEGMVSSLAAGNGPIVCGGTSELIGRQRHGDVDSFVLSYLPTLKRAWTKQIGSPAFDNCYEIVAESQTFAFGSALDGFNGKQPYKKGGSFAYVAQLSSSGQLKSTTLFGTPKAVTPRDFDLSKKTYCIAGQTKGDFEGLGTPPRGGRLAFVGCAKTKP